MERRRQRLAVDELEAEIIVPLDAATEVVKLDDGWMVNPRSRVDLAPQLLHGASPGQRFGMEKLDRARLVQRDVFRAVDGGGSAAPDLRLDAIAAVEESPLFERRRCRPRRRREPSRDQRLARSD